MVPPSSDRISRVPPYSRISRYLRIRGYHPLWPDFPDRSAYPQLTTGLLRVRSPLLAESLLMSFPPGTEMFQFPGFASTTYVFSCRYPRGWVAPFGHPRIKACSRLPVAFRSVPRPSSPPGAKASTECPSHTRYPSGLGHQTRTHHARKPSSANLSVSSAVRRYHLLAHNRVLSSEPPKEMARTTRLVSAPLNTHRQPLGRCSSQTTLPVRQFGRTTGPHQPIRISSITRAQRRTRT